MKIENLIESSKNQLEEIIENIKSKSFTNQAFDENIVEFFSDFSNLIIRYPNITEYPEILALGYWLRRGNIKKIIQDVNQNKNQIITPRGVAFHIAPANVDSIFIYSWALSLLSGNVNIMRITQNRNAQLDLLLSILKSALLNPKWTEINERNYIITYPHNSEISGFISLNSDLRIIWGGDDTILNIRSLPSKPTTKDVVFADKFSYCIIKSHNYINDIENRANLAHLFYNDAYMFNQMACSSPRLVYFVGETSENEKASEIFWLALENELKKKNFSLTPDLAMNKLIEVYKQSINKIQHKLLGSKNFALPTILRLENSISKSSRNTCGGGFFFEILITDLSNLKNNISANDQTLIYYGFSHDELSSFVRSVNGRGINRIVKIGEAMNFTPVWDGYVLLNEFTSNVYVN